MTRLAWIYGLLALVALACWPSAAVLGQLWADFANLSYSHGYALAAVSAWLLFRERAAIAAAPQRGSAAALGVLIAGALAWLVSWRAGLEVLHLVLLPALMGLAVYATFGRAVARYVTFPLLLLYFALPMWEPITPVLQTLTVVAVGALLKISNIPAVVDGNYVVLPVGTFEVAGGCAGLHFFVVGLALAALLGELDRQSLRRRALLLVLMAALALVSNWIRVYIIILAGHFRGMDHYLIHNHYVFGWVVFAFGVAVFFWLSRRVSVPASAVPFSDRTGSSPDGMAVFIRPVVATTLAVLVVPAVMGITRLREPGSNEWLVAFPRASQSWQGPKALTTTPWRPIFPAAHGGAHAAYQDEKGHRVEAFAVVYRSQRQGAELIGYDNSIYGEGQAPTQNTRIVQSPAGPFIEAPVAGVDRERSIIWFAYEVGGRRFTRPLPSQIWYGVSSLIAPQVSSLFALRANCAPDCDAARASLTRFAGDMGAGLMASLRQPAALHDVMLAAGPDQPPPRQLQEGLDHMQRGEFGEAEASFLEARDPQASALSAPHYAMVMAGLIEARLAQRKTEAAREAQGELARILPDAAPTRLLGARLMLAEGHSVEGVSELRRLVTAEPKYLPARLGLARVLMAQNSLMQAEAQLKAVLEQAPEHPEARALLAQLRQLSMKPQDTDNPLVLNNLAWRYFQQGDARAEPVARRAYELAPENAAIADTYGWILFQGLGKAQALPILAAAAAKAPGDREIQYHYGAALAASGKHSEARPVLQRLLAEGGAFPRRNEVEQLLRTLYP